MSLTDFLINIKELKSESLIEAFRKVERKDFLPSDLKEEANTDSPLPIGFDQTISQPRVVAFMLEELSPKKGENILDIGSGSGWTSTLLGEVVGEEGKVTAIERIKELVEIGEENIKKYNLIEKGIVEIYHYDGYKGFRRNAPYNRILVSAALKDKEDFPLEWIEQLKEGGVVVVPIGDSIFKYVKEGDNLIETRYPGFRFVPLKKDD